MTTTTEQYAVHFDGYRWECLPIVRVTAQKVICGNGKRERHLRRDDVPLVMAEDTARKVVERLTSSESLLAEDRRKAGLRRDERNAKIIEGARV